METKLPNHDMAPSAGPFAPYHDLGVWSLLRMSLSFGLHCACLFPSMGQYGRHCYVPRRFVWVFYVFLPLCLLLHYHSLCRLKSPSHQLPINPLPSPPSCNHHHLLSIKSRPHPHLNSVSPNNFSCLLHGFQSCVLAVVLSPQQAFSN